MENRNGQVALVTGGTRGIGLAISERLIRRGIHVAAGFTEDAESAKQLLNAHADARVTIHQADIGRPEECERVVREVLEEHGQIDVLVNNAGITMDKTVRKMTAEQWDCVVQVNLCGAFYLSRAVLNHMMDRGYGRIINISSVIGDTGNIGQANYAAAKAGLSGLTKSLALETAQKGITVNSVAPGFISTDMLEAVPEPVLEKIISQIPAGRLGEPDEVARLVEFLADPESGYITGQTYGINGGLHM